MQIDQVTANFGVVVLRLSGPYDDGADNQPLRDAVSDVESRGCRRVVLNLTGLTMPCDSLELLGYLAQTRGALPDNRVELRLAAVPDWLRKRMNIMNLGESLSVFVSETEAVESE